MKAITHDLSASGNDVKIVPLADLHIGDSQSDMKLIKNMPMTEKEATALYDALNTFSVTVIYTDPSRNGVTSTKTMRVTSNIEQTFALKSVDGLRRYKGGEIQLREA